MTDRKTQIPLGAFEEDSRSIYYINLIAGLILMILGVWGATQYCAHELGYQPDLGESWFVILGYPVYIPWRVFEWTYYYDVYASNVFAKSFIFIYATFGMEAILLVYIAVWRAKKRNVGDAYGTARWSTHLELEKSGLLSGEGVVIGKTGSGTIIQHDGPENVLGFAPPRSGKGVGWVIPSMLSWRGSVIINDKKGEIWSITAGFRQRFSHVLRFNPTSRDSVCFNPLLEVRKGDNEYRDAHTIAEMIVDTGDPNARQDHWERTSKALFVAAILHVLYMEEDKSIPGVATFLTNPDRDIMETLTYMMTCKHLGDRPHPIIASMTREVLNKSENELSAVISTATSFLTLYRDPVVASNLRHSDFTIKDLMHLDHPVSLYFTIPGSDTERTKPLIRLMLNQISKRLTEEISHDHATTLYKHRLLLMLDEFPTLGRMEFLETGLAFFSGYGIKAYLIAQSLNQIEKHYGDKNSIMDTCHIRITYGSLDERTARRISDLLGQSTQVRKMANYAGSRLAPWLGHVMVSEQESPRPLLTPGEILNMPNDANLLLIGGMFPYLGRKVVYYNDSRFKHRANQPAPNSEEAQRNEFPTHTKHPWVFVKNPKTLSRAGDSTEDVGTHDRTDTHNAGVSTELDKVDSHNNQQALDLERTLSDNTTIDQDNTREQDDDNDLSRQQIQRRLANQKQQGRTQELSRSKGGGDLPL